ncbi:ESPR-type extended signal peptide-containing protein [Megasphaera sp. CLA-AA-H81]|uniref:ESPR-type extended signal peptide-containing protein n=2 Tax=Megasphaera TaxID=906 RepID=A0ABV1CWH8_9FIRM
MNKIFKVIWSKSRNCYVVASELAKGHTKASSTGDKTRRLALAAITALILLPVGGFSYAADATIMVEPVGTGSTTAVEVYTKEGIDKGQESLQKDIQKFSKEVQNELLSIGENIQATDGAYVDAFKSVGENLNALDTQVKANADAINEEALKRKYSVTNLEKADAAEAAAREAADTALDTRITNVKEYLEKQTSDNYVSKDDAAVQDGAIVRAANTIGENVALLDKGLADETAARLGADAAQDKVIQQVNQNMVDGFNALSQADANELAGRVAADTKLAEAVNGGLSLSDNNVLQENTTTVNKDGTVSTSKEAATTLVMNEGKENQITLSENGIKVGTNSSVMDAKGVYTGGDNYAAAQAAMNADGSIKGANGKFTVDTDGNVASGNVTSTGTVQGATLTDRTATISNGNIKTNGGFIQTGGGNVNTQGGEVRTNGGKVATSGGEINTGSGNIKTVGGDILTAGGKLNTSGGDIVAGTGNISGQNITASGVLSGDSLTVAKGMTGHNLTLTGGDLDAGAGTIKTTGEVDAGTLNVSGKATVKDLEVQGEFNAKTLSSKLDKNNYTEIHGGNVTSVNSKVDTTDGKTYTSTSTLTEKGKTETASNGINRNVEKMNATESSNVITNDANGKTSTFEQHVDEILNQINSSDTVFSKVDQKVDNITSEVTDGTNTTSSTQTTTDITNTATNGTISNNAKELTNTASDSITNKAENGNISNIASNGTISNEAKTISNKAAEAMTNDAKTITNTASESVTTQIGDGSAVQSVMNESGITNNATDKTVATNAKDILNTATGNITNSAANGTITNTAKDLVNTATGNMTNTVGGELKTTVTGKVTEDYKSDLDTKVGGNQTTTVTGDSSLTAENITNEAKNKITNKAIDVETDASSSIVSKVSNEYGSNTSTQLSYQTKEEMSQVDGKTASYLRGAAEEKSQLTDGDKKTTIDTIAGQTNTTVVNQDAMSLASSITDGTKANNTNSTVDKSEQLIKASDTQYSATTKTATKTEDALANGSTLIDIIKDSTTGMVSSAVTDGNTSTGISQSAKDISLSAAGGTIANAAQNITNTASESITNTVGKTTVTTTDSGTTFENTDHNTAIKDGSITKTTISGNTLTTGQATMDYADVMKDLGVRGNATVDGDTTLGKEGADTKLTVNSKSTFKDTVKLEKTLEVDGTSTFNNKVTVTKGGLDVNGGTTTDTLHVTSTSTFDGAATFKDAVTMEKDLSVGGNATVAGSMTASSYKIGDKTYIDSTGINANNQKIVNVAAGDLSASSTDAVNGAQLYQTNERVASVENRVDTVENRVSNLDSRVDKVGANAAALANLHPLEFDADSKWNIAAAVGGYKGETATAIGAFYRPNENVMVNVSSSFGTGENMYGGGISLRIGQGGNKARRNATNGLTEREKAQQKQIDYLTSRLDALLSVINPNMSKDFPDVPENHWAYEAVSKLAGNGIIQGYEDGKYHGERTMTRYEMAEIIYNALSKGAKAEKKLVEEFKPELQAMAAQKKA